LRRLRAAACEANQCRAATDASTEMRQLQRGISRKRRQPNEILRRHLQKVVELERAILSKKRKRIRSDRIRKDKLRQNYRKNNAKKVAKAAARKENEKKLLAIPAVFTPKDCGQGGKHGLTARKNCLERLRLRAPPLPLPLEVIWKDRRDAYAKQMATIHGIAVGTAFIAEVNDCLRALGVHYRGPTTFNGPGILTGSDKAFEVFVRRMGRILPIAAKSITL
jgi:hypothetical protein